MKDKLEFKHIAPYLPYGLEVKTEYYDMIVDIKGVEDDYFRVGTNYSDKGGEFDLLSMNSGDSKIILRPLSDLTEEIEHNGEKFVPLNLLDSDHYPTDYFDRPNQWLYEYIEGWAISKDPSHHLQFLPYGLVQQLIEWKFNVFNLPTELFIDVNSLDINPYK